MSNAHEGNYLWPVSLIMCLSAIFGPDAKIANNLQHQSVDNHVYSAQTFYHVMSTECAQIVSPADNSVYQTHLSV